MKFRPCIDIHNGKVKQIVGSSLRENDGYATDWKENFVAQSDADYYARRYREDELGGGHIILLNPPGSAYYEEDVRQAGLALAAYPGGLQIGGGIRAETADSFLELGASHVIVTSYAFSDGRIQYEHLRRLVQEVGREHIVLDVSCRRTETDGAYRIVTDRWQTFTEVAVTGETLQELAGFCDEFLIHAVDVEGMCSGIEQELAALLGENTVRPMTYAGGVSTLADIRLLYELGHGNLDVTIGSALDLFGGSLRYQEVLEEIRRLPGNTKRIEKTRRQEHGGIYRLCRGL